MKSHAVSVALKTQHKDTEIAHFLKVVWSFIVKMKKELVNRDNDQWLCRDLSEVLTVMHTKFSASVMVLGVVSNEGVVMPPFFFFLKRGWKSMSLFTQRCWKKLWGPELAEYATLRRLIRLRKPKQRCVPVSKIMFFQTHSLLIHQTWIHWTITYGE